MIVTPLQNTARAHGRTSTEEASPKRLPHDDIVWAMEIFAELVDGTGPLCALRFDKAAFAACLTPATGPATEEAIERSFAKHIESVATPRFLRHLQATLSAFGRMTYVDESHRLAANIAQMLTPTCVLAANMRGRDAPALYPIYRAQLLEARPPVAGDGFDSAVGHPKK